jgi:hypothetical protein
MLAANRAGRYAAPAPVANKKETQQLKTSRDPTD